MEEYAPLISKHCTSVFHDLGKIEVRAGKPFVSDVLVDAPAAGEDVSAIMGLAGAAKGLVWLSMKKAVALKLVDKLTGKTHGTVDQQVIDVLGEIANIMAGRVKQVLQEEFRFELAFPIVIQGSIASLPNGQSFLTASRKRISIPFTFFEDEQFTLSVSIQA
jgi:chemotaxis protein CheX